MKHWYLDTNSWNINYRCFIEWVFLFMLISVYSFVSGYKNSRYRNSLLNKFKFLISLTHPFFILIYCNYYRYVFIHSTYLLVNKLLFSNNHLYNYTGFSSKEDDPSNPSTYRGNQVYFVSNEGETITCPVVDHYTSLTQIVCLAP